MHYPLTDRFERVPLAMTPTPLEPMPRLTGHLGGPTLYVKRDDCTGLAFGGNKTRKLEFLMADALAAGADTIVTTGAVQSNHARQAAAAAAKLGLKAVLVLSESVEWADDAYVTSGNVMLAHLVGATVEIIDGAVDGDQAMEKTADRIRERGGTPYVVPRGGSGPVGALGYVRCAEELVTQAADADVGVTHVVQATGSAGTQSGMISGLAALGSPIRPVPIAVRPSNGEIQRDVERIVPGVLELLETDAEVPPDHFRVDEAYSGPAYGIPTDETVEAIRLAARLEGLLLDPVYTGKAMAGLIALARQGVLNQDHTVVFLHTGGAPGLFAYPSLFQGS